MKYLVGIARIIVGFLFVISGLIKLNDPVGFAFKLQDYFAPEVLNLEFLMPYALPLAILLVIVEVLVGVALLIGYFKRLTLWLLLLMIVFFTFLTFYSAYFNKVTDCGCFGDAIPLTPWESFYKDVILLILILILFAGRKYIQPVFKPTKGLIVTGISLILCIALGYHVLNHLPIMDFRAYKKEVNIKEAMAFPENAPKDEFDIKFIYEVNGNEQAFTMEELGNIPSGAEFVRRDETLISKGYEPPISDFSIEKDGNDYTEDFLDKPKVLMVIAYDLGKANTTGLDKLAQLEKDASEKGYEIIGLTSSSEEVIQTVKSNHQMDFEFYFCDATTLKAIVRSNPGVVVLEYGTIKDKKHWNDLHKLKL